MELRSIARTAAAALALALFAAPPAAHAEGVTVKTTASATWASRYVWRGQTLSTGTVIQPTITATYGGFSANLWSNLDLDKDETTVALNDDGTPAVDADGMLTYDGDDDNAALNETDLTLSYTYALGKLSATAGYIYYGFDGARDTQEVSLALGVATYLNPTLTCFYDVDEGDGGFAILSVSQAIPVTGKISVTPGASVGLNMNDKAMGTDADGEEFFGLYYGEVFVSTSIPVFGAVSLDPRLSYAFGLGDGKDAIGAISVDGKEKMFSGSVALTLAF
jgi:hypothetical protein